MKPLLQGLRDQQSQGSLERNPPLVKQFGYIKEFLVDDGKVYMAVKVKRENKEGGNPATGGGDVYAGRWMALGYPQKLWDLAFGELNTGSMGRFIGAYVEVVADASWRSPVVHILGLKEEWSQLNEKIKTANNLGRLAKGRTGEEAQKPPTKPYLGS